MVMKDKCILPSPSVFNVGQTNPPYCNSYLSEDSDFKLFTNLSLQQIMLNVI